ncbi:hypothetical protein C4573_02215 [Candidatus Woesearchaeota archaeon]|nr:MAG: hypothetical protein C4573_02215 [Candidatus Woesearchaeota archaeon]
MTCQKCATRQILQENELICPKCNGIEFLPKDVALSVAQAQINWFDNGFKQVLGKFIKRRLLVWLFGYREKIASTFFTEKPSIELSKFIAVNLLIKRVMEDYDVDGDDEANEKNTPELIDLFAGFVRIAERKFLIEEDLGHYISKSSFDLKSIDKDRLMSNFSFRINEDYVPILESFEDNLIMNEDSAKAFFEVHKAEYERINKSKPVPTERTPEETIQILFPTLLAFYGALTKNKLYAETFNLQYLKDVKISPQFILSFIKKFGQQTGLMTQTNSHEFKRAVRVYFKELDKNIVYDNLVFSKDNKQVFPFFLNVDNHLLITHNFIRLMGLFYYPMYYDSEFKKEIDKHSMIFEKTMVPEKLREQGFTLIQNYTDKKQASLEIDNIAWKGNTLYVIETKVWDIKPYFEHRRIHYHRERDLKGVVDGKKYTYLKGSETVTDIVSLLDKIKHVQDNLSQICKDAKMITTIKGVVITKSHPTIQEYKEVKFIGFSHLNTL